jgi:hypothetical protein
MSAYSAYEETELPALSLKVDPVLLSVIRCALGWARPKGTYRSVWRMDNQKTMKEREQE